MKLGPLLVGVIWVAWTACHPRDQPSPMTLPVAPVAVVSSGETTGSAPISAPAQATASVAAPRAFSETHGGISLRGVRFDDRTHTLLVADQIRGPGAEWEDSRAAGRSMDGLAAINASFFDTQGNPIGLVISAGHQRGAMNRGSSIGAGIFLKKEGGELALRRREQFEGAVEALQAGPFLVENGKSVEGLSNKQSSARSLVATDGRHGWVIARTGACSLAEVGRALAGARLGEVEVRQALNLDGGRSSELWISGQIHGGPEFVRPLWNRAARNFLVLKERNP